MLSQGHKAAFKRGYKALAVAGLAALAACGGGGGTSVTMPTAFGVLGQADFTHGGANRSNAATIAANGIGNSLGGVAVVNVGSTQRFYAVDSSNNRILGWTSIPTGNAGDDTATFVLGQTALTGAINAQPNQGFGAPTASTLWAPSSVYTDGTRLVVADTGNNRVLVWDTLPITSNAPATRVFGQQGGDFTTNAAATTPGTMTGPVAAVITGNKLLVTDTGNNRVMIWNSYVASSPGPSFVGGAADVFLGQPNGNTGTPLSVPTSASLSSPNGLWSDGRQVLVSDTSNNRVMYWSPVSTTSGIAAAAVIGQANFGALGAGSSATTLSSPLGLSTDGTTLFIADSGNNRVLRYDSFPPAANGVSASAVFGQDNFTNRTANDDDQNGQQDTVNGSGTATQPSARTFSGPRGVTLTAGVVYVTDTTNHRIMLFNPQATD